MTEPIATFIPILAHPNDPPAHIPAEVWPALLNATSVARATGSGAGSTVVGGIKWTASRSDGVYWFVTKPGPWHVVITRTTEDFADMEPIVIGPFDTEADAVVHCQDSLDVEDWCTGEAKAKGYIVDDCYVTNTAPVPSYGINAPVPDEPEEPTMEDAVAHLVLAGVDPAAIINGTLAAPAPQAPSVWVAVVEYGSESGNNPTPYVATTEGRAWVLAVTEVMAEAEGDDDWREAWPEFVTAHGFDSTDLDEAGARAWYEAYHMDADGERWITVTAEDVDAA